MLWTGVIINQCYLVSTSPTSFFPLWDHNSKAFICYFREIEAQTETWLILSEGRGKTHKERWFCTGGLRLPSLSVRWPLFGSVVSVSPVFYFDSFWLGWITVMPDDGVKGNRVQTWMTYGSTKNNELNNKVSCAGEIWRWWTSIISEVYALH